MSEAYTVEGTLERFEGKGGWTYLPLPEDMSEQIRPQVASAWPALLKVQARVEQVGWVGTIMPIKDGPLFLSFPASIRARLGVKQGDEVTLHFAIVEL